MARAPWGYDIALAALKAGRQVGLSDVSAEMLAGARAHLEKYLARREARRRLERLQLRQELPELGGSVCRSIHYCRDCQQPFEAFKPL